MSDGEGESPRENEDADSCDEIRRHGGMLSEHGDVLAKLKMQVRDIKVTIILHLSLFISKTMTFIVESLSGGFREFSPPELSGVGCA